MPACSASMFGSCGEGAVDFGDIAIAGCFQQRLIQQRPPRKGIEARRRKQNQRSNTPTRQVGVAIWRRRHRSTHNAMTATQ